MCRAFLCRRVQASNFLQGCNALMACWRIFCSHPTMKGDSFKCGSSRSILSIYARGNDRLAFLPSQRLLNGGHWSRHALEEMGMGGFLTGKHTVRSVRGQVEDALSYVDAHSFDCLVKINVDMLAFHWRSMTLHLDKPKSLAGSR